MSVKRHFVPELSFMNDMRRVGEYVLRRHRRTSCPSAPFTLIINLTGPGNHTRLGCAIPLALAIGHIAKGSSKRTYSMRFCALFMNDSRRVGEYVAWKI